MKSAAVVVCAVSAFATSLAAQCLDARGNPSPCAPATTRRDPPPDNRRWIVLPFRNLARDDDLDWLSQASVNLLYIDMSRWTDIQVLDDGRVLDLLRDMPEASRSQIGLEAGLALAKRVGAGNLVMGDLLKEGPRTTITAKVYDVRTGERVRTVTQRIVGTDSLTAGFSALAQQVLAVPPPPGSEITGVGTRSIEALKAYTLAVLAVARGRGDSALIHLRHAVTSDSTFALAYMSLAWLLGSNGRPDEESRAYDAATRYAGTLPERERLIIALNRRQGVTRAVRCESGNRLLALDSTDQNGWLATGACFQSNTHVVVDAAGHIRAEGDWNAARNAYERAMDWSGPTPYYGFQSVMNLYFPEQRLVCSTPVDLIAQCPTESLYVAANVLEGDTIATRFERWRDARFNPPARRPDSRAGVRARQTAARDLGARFAAANPGNLLGHLWYAIFLIRMGDLAGAERALAASAELGIGGSDNNRTIYQGLRITLALRRERPERAAPLLDSLFFGVPLRPANGAYVTAFGQFRRDFSMADTAPAVRLLRTVFNAGFVGVISPDFAQTVRGFADARAAQALPGRREAVRQEILELGTVLGFHTLKTGPALDTASAFPLLRYQAFVARADTARARTALAEYDAWGAEASDDQFDGHEMFAAESFLELGDSAAAWARIEPFGRRWSGYALLQSGPSLDEFWNASGSDLLKSTRAIGRAWLLYADLAMATGHQDEARRGYRMVVGLWEKGEPPVQPLVARARAALAKLN